ncbi:beta strand repeat-containing protein [Hymenobacter properus]|uniref:T9SS type A sorting domain-containing protein n=1 Tax=Hymenobacter properus TaxID=2791026 RepID=A0A931BHA2_9BACT|nr:T9SS type A sorting domain-containing protein [Hymenobacter properus]MBF9141277.1 T9SS type A sorting domain-containing protein [Hymenobacter properus]MBR7720087.1 T9SS type A sorting domain-containing protein [Microvirga sp. SRT04]
MRKTLLHEPQSSRLGILASGKRLARLLGVGALLLGSAGAQAQTATTVFSETFEGATNSFTIVNGSQVNQWYVGTVGGNGPTTPGTKSAYISNDAGASNAYTITTTAVAHMYRDVTFPAGQSVVDLGFDWKAGGESIYDYIQVFLVPTTVTPVAGTQLVNGTSGAVQIGGNINLQTAFGRTTLQLPGNVAGTTQRLVITWRNDASGGVQPPAVIDNISSSAATANPISGAYTINSAQPTAGTNFTSFTDAATRLNRDGVNGPLTLTVLGGPYTEQFMLNAVSGTSATNTIVVNGGGRTIQFASTNSNQRAVVQLNGTDYTTINNLVIDPTGGTGASPAATYGYGVLLTNVADNDRITNCTINNDLSSTSSNFIGIAVSGSLTSGTTSGNSANNLTLEGNTVNGGYYGVTLYGNSTTAFNTGNVLRNNNIRDFYLYGVYVGYQDGAQFIGNDLSRLVRTNGSTFYGFYSFSSRGLAFEKNRLHDPFTANPTSTSTLYGIYLANGTTPTATTTNDVVNNVLYNLNGNGSQYVIYNSGSAYSRIYNNSISSDDQTGSTSTTYGIYSSGTSADIKNNVVSITRAGSGTKYGLYYTVSGTTSNYNDIFVPNGNVGYYNAAFATLASWQAANGNAFDQNSVSTDPVFTSASNLTPGNVLLNNSGTPLARVTDDIVGTARGAAPDMGAYEFTPVAIDVAAASLLTPAANTTCYSPTEAVSVLIRNNGSAALNFANNAATVTVVVTPPTGPAQTFTTTINTGTLATGATQTVTLPGTLNMSAVGAYSFAVTATVTGDLNTANNTLATVTRTAVAPVAGTLSPATSNICFSGTASLSLAGSANGNIQLQSSSSATGPFTDVAGATSATYTTPVLNSTTYYRYQVTCNTNVVYSNVSAITVNAPAITAAPSPLSVCAGGTASLSATVPTGINVRYYTAATGGTLVGTGNPFVTPALTANTTYYAEAFSGGQENVGKASTTGADGTNTIGGLYFTTTGATTITSVTVYRAANAAAGTATIHLLNGSTTSTTNPVATVTVPVPANTTGAIAPAVLTLNFAVPAAGNYTLYLSAATPSLMRDYSTSAGISFPYVSPSGTVRITDGTLAGYYYFFYNWQIGSECVSTNARTPIQVNVTPGLVATLGTASATSCGRTPYTLNGAIGGTATGGTYTSSGTGTFSPNATTLNATYTPSAADVAAGTVTLTLTPTGPSAACTQTAQTVLSLSTPPNASFSYPAGTYCTNSPVTVTPVLAPGAVAGTFSTTGIGLRIDPVTGVITLANTNIDGTFTITNTVAATGACSGSTAASATTTFTVIFGIGQPTLTATPQAGGAVVLSTPATAGVTYQFYRSTGGGAPVAVGTPTATGTLQLTAGAQSGSYTVVAISANGCTSIPSAAVTATVLGTQTASLNGVSLRVFPNPTADGQLSVELSGINAKASQLTVLNALGQVVHTGTVAVGTAQLQLSQLASGVYTFRVQTEQGVLTQRVVRQ